MQQTNWRALPRQDVVRTLAKAITSHHLTVVTAPAGYGKTTVARKLTGRNRNQLFFHPVPAGLGSADSWWDSLFENLTEQGMEHAAALRRAGFPKTEFMTRDAVQLIADVSRPFVLILDDCHNFMDDGVDGFLETLVRSQPAGHRFVMFSRALPRMRLDDLRREGLAAAFGRELLEFSETGAKRFFFLNGVSDPAAAEQAWRYSEGWAAAMWLCLHNRRSGGETPPAGDVGQLLEKAVFAAYSGEDRDFLTKLSALDAFTADEAEALVGDPRAAARLRRLSGGNALIRRDAEGGRYVFHSIFKEFLAGKLAERDDLNIPELHRRAAECHVRRREFMPAYRLLARIGRDEDLVRILDILLIQNGEKMFRFQLDEIRDIVDAIPWRLCLRQPLGYLAYVWVRFSIGLEPEDVKFFARTAERFRRAKDIPPLLRRRLAGEIEFARGWLNLNGDRRKILTHYVEAQKILDGPSVYANDRVCWNSSSPHMLFVFIPTGRRYRGDIDAMCKEISPSLSILYGGLTEGTESICEAEYLVERADFDEAARLLDDIDQLVVLPGNMTGAVLAAFSRARLLAATGNPAEAIRVFEKLAPPVEAGESFEHIQSFELAAGYVLAGVGRPEDAAHWLLRGDIFEQPYGDTHIQCFMVATYGKLLLARDDYDGFAALMDRGPGLFGPEDLLFSRIHQDVFSAVLFWRNRKCEAAVRCLRKAVDRSRADGFILSIAEYGRHILPVIRELRRLTPRDAHLEKLFELTARIHRLHARKGRGGSEPLTHREREVMRLVVKGRSTPSIAARLGAPEATVKNTLSALYRKLGAGNRAEAARRYQMLYGRQPQTVGDAGRNSDRPAPEPDALMGVFRAHVRAGGVEDFCRALDLFLLPESMNMTAHFQDEVFQALASLPWRARLNRPLGYLAALWQCFRTGSLPMAGLPLEEAEERMLRAGEASAESPGRLAGEMALLWGMFRAHDADGFWARHKEAAGLLAGPSALYSPRVSWSFGNPHLTFSSVREPGGYEKNAAALADASEALSVLSGGRFASLEATYRMERHLERGETDAALSLLPALEERGGADVQAAVIAAFARARLLLADGRTSEAEKTLGRLEAAVRSLNSHEHTESLDLAVRYIRAQMGIVWPKPRLSGEEPPAAPSGCAMPRLPFALVVYGKSLAASGDFKLLGSVARTMPQRFGRYGSLLGHIHAKVMEAAAARHVRSESEAVERLRSALELARADGLAFAIAEYGGMILPLLRRIARENPDDAHIAKAAALTERMGRTVRSGGGTKKKATQKTLTLREREIMRLAVRGLSGVAMAQSLGVSQSRISKALSIIYEKLGASNRAEAARLFEMGIDDRP